ncbi:MAG: YggS family pyridoxal phosphate-dependent enzyme, partial [Cytophagales bacterium]|nr:YggS family pyridoxal phosphate-dependent enzyme [Cytophagales bacterium]
MSLANNLEAVRQQLAGTPARLVAVSKTKPASLVLEAYESGQRIFGENKVQELCDKREQLPPDIEWHMIGHLQSNKVKYIAPFVSLIHGVDSFKLLREIDKQGKKINRPLPCLLQMHIAQEETKFGFSEAELMDTLASADFQSLTHVHVMGLMGMASLTDDKSQIQREFSGLRALFERLAAARIADFVQMKELSMGMSSDYRMALEE